MKTQISFITELFDSGKANAGAGGVPAGEDLARWFIKKSKGGEFTFGEPVGCMSGWMSSVTAEGEKFELGFGIIDGSAGSDYAEWRIFIRSINRWKLFGSSKDSELRGHLCDLVHNVLRDEGKIREVHWGE